VSIAGGLARFDLSSCAHIREAMNIPTIVRKNALELNNFCMIVNDLNRMNNIFWRY
jgi:hypothetical protein